MTTRKGLDDLGNNGPFKKPKLQMKQPDMWGDDSDEDDLILQASQAVEQNNNLPAPSNFSSFMNDFEKDSRTSTQTEEQSQAVAISIAMRTKISSNLVLNQNKTSQDVLRKRIETLEKDTQKAKEEWQAAVERIQIKDYEVSSLKYEMKELQRANNDLRMKLVKNEKFAKEMDRNKTLEKQLQNVETKYELKKLELLKLKSDRRMSSQSPAVPANCSNVTKNDDRMEADHFQINTLPGRYELTMKTDSWQFRMGHRIFENAHNDAGMGTAVFVEQLSHLQRATGLFFCGKTVDVDQFMEHSKEALNLALNIISTKFDSTLQMYGSKRSRWGNFLSDDHCHQRGVKEGRPDVCIFDKEPMYPNEELIVFRRILSIIALGAKFSSDVRSAFYGEKVCDTLIKIIRGLSRTADEYQKRTSGIIQAATVLLLNLIEGDDVDVKKIPLLFKALSFARLDSFSLFMIMKSLKSLDGELNRTFLCTNSNEYVMNPIYKTARFSTNSCLLQIFATSMESTFPAAETEEYWTIWRYRRLLSFTLCLMRFFRENLLDINADWMTVNRSCLCYLKLTTSFIVLTHLCLHLSQTIPKLRAEMRRIQTVSQLALLLLHDLFTANRQTELNRRMGKSIKNRLIVVYNMLMQYNELFHFRLAQVKALESFEVNLLTNSFQKSNTKDVVPSDARREKGISIWNSIAV